MGPSDENDQPARSLVRASDAERNQTIEVLAAACAEGRLSLEEYSERSEAALAARTVGDLSGMTADLPAHSRAAAVPVPVEITAVLGNESRKGPWVVPAHLTVRSVLGDCHLEMQQAVIRQEQLSKTITKFQQDSTLPYGHALRCGPETSVTSPLRWR